MGYSSCDALHNELTAACIGSITIHRRPALSPVVTSDLAHIADSIGVKIRLCAT
jgi:hypothetical protein